MQVEVSVATEDDTHVDSPVGLEDSSSGSNEMASEDPLAQAPREGEEEKKNGGLWQGFFGFVNVMIGGGCLVLPWVIGQCGLVLGFLMIVLMAAASLYTQRLLCFVSMHYFQRPASYSELALASFGRLGKWIADGFYLLYLFGALVGYVEILGSSFLPFVNMIPKFHMDKIVLEAILCMAVLFPLSSTPFVNQLQWTNAMAIIIVAILTVSLIYSGILNVANGAAGAIWFPNGTQGLLVSIPVVSFAFTFQMNIYSIWDEQIDPSLQNVNYISILSVVFVLVVYLIISLFGYMSFFNTVAPNILDGFASSYFLFVKAMYCIVIAFSYPMLNYPVRTRLDQMLFSRWPRNVWRDACISFVVAGLAFGVAATGLDINSIFGLVGATAGITVTWILPSLFYVFLVDEQVEAEVDESFALQNNKDDDASSPIENDSSAVSLDSANGAEGSPESVVPVLPPPSPGCFTSERRPLRYYFSQQKLLRCWPLVLFGVVLGILGVTQIIISLVHPPPAPTPPEPSVP